MGRLGVLAARTCWALVLLAPACSSGSATTPHPARPADAAAADHAPAPDASTPLPPERLPARIRRLSNAEVAASVAALLPGTTAMQDFAPDTRQSRFTVNAAQRVDPLWAAELQAAFHAAATAGAPALVT